MCAVLVVDDHGETRRALTTLLSHWGHTVSTADNVASALRFIEQKVFDVILSDIELPDGDGYQVVAEIRKRKITAITAAVSGLDSEDDVEKAGRAGFHHHFSKPLDPLHLRGWLDAVIQS